MCSLAKQIIISPLRDHTGLAMMKYPDRRWCWSDRAAITETKPPCRINLLADFYTARAHSCAPLHFHMRVTAVPNIPSYVREHISAAIETHKQSYFSLENFIGSGGVMKCNWYVSKRIRGKCIA